MKLRVLGSGTAIPHPARGASGYALLADGVALLLECGPGSTRRWPSAGVDFESARVIVVSHHHVDHCCDLPAVLFGRNVPRPRVASPLALIGPRGHRAHVAAIEAMYGDWVADEAGAREVLELGEGDAIEREGFSIEAFEMAHSPGALGVRVSRGGRTLAFSGDTAPCDALVALCRGADLALLECSYPAGQGVGRHLDAAMAGRAAAEAGLARLVLTHFYPACDGVDLEAQVRAAGYDGALELARDGASFDV